MIEREDRARKTRERLLIMTVAFGILLNPLNTTMISVALSRLQEQYHLSFGELSWMISTYYLVSAVAQPLMGKWSDLFGRKKVFLFGLFLVTLASGLAPLSPTFGWLIGFRMIQALGSSALYPAGMGIIRSYLSGNQARALGAITMFSSTSAALGPSIGGFLLHYGDWPLIFLCNFPFIIVSFWLAWKLFPADGPAKGRWSDMDWSGVVLFSGAIFVWLLFLLAWPTGVNGWLLALAIVLTIALIICERRQSQPFIDVKFLYRNRQVSTIYVQYILTNIAFYALLFGMPSYLQQARGMDPQQTGLMMLSVAGFSFLVTPLVSRWIERSGSRPSLLLGTCAVVIGSLLLLLIVEETPFYVIFACLSVLGIANGFNNLAMQTALYEYIERSQTGIASGLFMTARFLGTILSSSLLAVLFGGTISGGSLHMMAAVCAGIGLVMFGLTFLLNARNRTLQDV